MMHTLMQDLRYAFRMLVKSPGFAVTAVLTLALGIGANTALFSVVNGVLLTPLPYPHPEQLTALYEVAPGFDRASMSYPNFQDWQRMSRSFSSMAIYRNQDYTYAAGDQAERLSGYMVSADFFRTLGQTAAVGRDLEPADDRLGAAPVVILGGGFWQREFGGSRSVIGHAITLNGAPYTVIGVMPASFTFYGAERDVYVPIGPWTDPSFRDRGIEVSTHAVARLKPGITIARAQADMDAVARNLAAEYPVADKQLGVAVVSMKQNFVGNVRPFLLVLLGAVGFLLLITCANVANLLLARAMGRSREFAIRAALGASRSRVVRQLLTESVLLAGAGGIAGLALAAWGTTAIIRVLPGALPRSGDVHVDARVLAFTVAASLATGFLFGLVPALRSARVDLQEVLKQSGRAGTARHRAQRVLVSVEVGLALVLLVGAGLMLRTLQALWHVNPGFTPDHAITFVLSLPSSPNTTSAETRARLRAFDATMRNVPGVDAVSVTLGSRPMVHDTALPFWIQGQPRPATIHDMPETMCYLVEAGFRDAMGIRLERGRFVTDQDDEHAPVVIDIDDDFARKYFPHQDPIGQRVNIGGFDVQAEIVGVVGHVKQWRLDADPASAVEAQIYYPFMQLPEKLMPLASDAVAVVVRTKGDPAAIMADVRRAVHQFEPHDVIYGVETMDAIVAQSYAARTLTMLLLVLFSLLALVLACVGVAGVVSYLVGQRTREFGLRMALGARRADVLRLVLAQGLRMAIVGTLAGSAAALGLTRLMSGELFGVGARDPLTFGVVAGALILVTLAACYFPARHATRVDPMEALRAE